MATKISKTSSKKSLFSAQQIRKAPKKDINISLKLTLELLSPSDAKEARKVVPRTKTGKP